MYRWLIGGLLVFALLSVSVQAAEAVGPIRTLIDVRTTHSDGAHDMDTLVGMAKARGIQAMAFTDHGRKGIRFGIEPVPNILGYTKDYRSLYTTGLASFFADLKRMRQAHPEMVLFAGTESIAGYEWTGIPFRNLTLHHAERMFITLGEERPAQIESLPSYTLKHARGDLPLSVVFWTLLVFAVTVFLFRRRKRGVALLLIVSFIAFLATLLLRPAVDANADFIKAAHQQGLFTIWAYPGTHSGVRSGPMGVQLDTPPYSRRVFTDPTADAFAAVYGDTDSNTVPGGLWDGYLADYMIGIHAHPIWAVSAGDFHKQGQAKEYLGNFPMDVWAAKRSPAAILAAMRAGHTVNWGLRRDRNLHVTELYLGDMQGKHLLPGDEARVTSQVTLHVGIDEMRKRETPHRTRPLMTEIIMDGKVATRLQLRPGMPQQEVLQLAPGPHVIRLRIPAQGGVRMVANPFLVQVAG